MEKLYTDIEFDLSSEYAKLPFKCKSCREVFYRTKKSIVEQTYNGFPIHYCSQACNAQGKARKALRIVRCGGCGKRIPVPKHRVFATYKDYKNYCEPCEEIHIKRRTNRTYEIKELIKPGEEVRSPLKPEEAVDIYTARLISRETKEAKSKALAEKRAASAEKKYLARKKIEDRHRERREAKAARTRRERDKRAELKKKRLAFIEKLRQEKFGKSE